MKQRTKRRMTYRWEQRRREQHRKDLNTIATWLAEGADRAARMGVSHTIVFSDSFTRMTLDQAKEHWSKHAT